MTQRILLKLCCCDLCSWTCAASAMGSACIRGRWAAASTTPCTSLQAPAVGHSQYLLLSCKQDNGLSRVFNTNICACMQKAPQTMLPCTSRFMPHWQTACQTLSRQAPTLATPPRVRAGEAWLLACNNDHTVKVFGLPSMRALGAVACPVAANYAALSPDGQQLVVVGDSPDVHLVRTTPTGMPPGSPPTQHHPFCDSVSAESLSQAAKVLLCLIGLVLRPWWCHLSSSVALSCVK